MVHYVDYADYPTEEMWEKLYDSKKEAFDKLKLAEEAGKKSYIINSEGIREMKLSFWINEYNNKVYDLTNNYILLKHYYDKGIPDSEWFIEKNGKYKLFPHMEDKHDGYKYWFDFYLDGYYKRFSTLIDAICHLINIKYGFQIESSSGFRQNVMGKLKSEDNALFKSLTGFMKDKTYKQVEIYRNDLTHNYRPNYIDSGITERRDGNKIIITGGLGNYTTTTEFIINIESSIDLMANIVDSIRLKIQPVEV